MAKLRLTGLKNGVLHEVQENTDKKYSVKECIKLKYLQSATKEATMKELNIYADDDIYDNDSEFDFEDIEVTLVELGLELEALLRGSEFETGKDEYTFKATDIAPDFALGFAAMRKDGGHRMYMYYRAKPIKVKVDHQTKGVGEEQPYIVSFRCTKRAVDGSAFTIKDVAAGEPLTWLDAIAEVNTEASNEGGLEG